MAQKKMCFQRCSSSEAGIGVIRLSDIEKTMTTHGLIELWQNYLLLKTLPTLPGGEVGVPEYRLTCFLNKHNIHYEIS